MPWKNKKGITSQIAISPANSTLEKLDFDFRLSSAPVVEDGVFSKFPGYQRLLLPIRGKGFSLNGALYEQHEVAAFSGDDETHCELVNGDIVDLGLIYNDKKIKASAKVLRLKDVFNFSAEPKAIYFVYILQGKVTVNEIESEDGDTVHLENPERVILQATKTSSVVLFSLAHK